MASHQVEWDQPFPPVCRGGAVSIGNFDGAHRGHALLLAELRRLAREVGGPAVAFTFDPHPLRLLHPERPLLLLTAPEHRAGLLHELGADEVVVVRTTPALLALTAEAFFGRVVRGRLEARALAEGETFGFGRHREGNARTLGQLCAAAGLPLAVVPPLVLDGATVSSSRIRAALGEGAVEEARRLLGRP